MARTKREYILATCFLSGAAAILSFVALGTEAWVTSPGIVSTLIPPDNHTEVDSSSFFTFGLFGGTFDQKFGQNARYRLTTVCAYDLNICGLLCGDNMEHYLKIMHDGGSVDAGLRTCVISELTKSYHSLSVRASEKNDTVFLNTGVWLCTIFFLVLSAVMGLFCAGLSVWNTATSPYQAYFSTFGLYIYNAIAFVLLLLAMILWGVVFAQTFTKNIPTYKTYAESFTTDASLGYSYWLLIVSLCFYPLSICSLYVRQYLIAKEPKVNLQLEDNADPVIYLY